MPATTRLPRGLLILLPLSAVLVAGCLSAPLITFDDAVHITTPVVRCTEPWYHAFSWPAQRGSYFPFTTLSFRMEYIVFENMLGFQNWAPFIRIDNLLLHMSAGISIYLICTALSITGAARLFVTGAFLVHPTACESVAWACERKNTLTIAFSFASLAMLLHFRSRWWRAPLAGALYLIAAFSKPAAVGMLPVLLLVEASLLWTNRRKKELSPAALMGSVAGIAIILAAGLGSLRMNLAGAWNPHLRQPGGSLYTGLLTDSEVLTRYFNNLLFPFDLSAFYYVKPILSMGDPRFILDTCLVVAFVAGTTLLSTRRILTLFFWYWFFSALGPVFNLVPFSFVMQDRFIYYSSPAFFAVIALACEGLAVRLKDKAPSISKATPRLGFLTACVAIVAFALTAVLRSCVWDNGYTLFADAVRKQPQSVHAHLLLGVTVAKMADWADYKHDSAAALAYRKEAAEHLKLACTLEDSVRLLAPQQPWGALAYVQKKLGALDEAEATARKALTIPRMPQSISDMHALLGDILLDEKRPDEALVEADLALSTSAESDAAWLLKGSALEMLGRKREAADAYARVPKGNLSYPIAQDKLKKLSL